jgi:putative heme-binding domain-containing protein
MAKLGPGHMPYTGSNVIDTRGLDLVHEWVRQLPEITGQRTVRADSIADEQRAALGRLRSGADPEAIDRLLASTSGALYALRGVDTGQVAEAARKQLVEAARKHPAAAVRDLFERFVPEDERVKRLGSVVKPAAILALRGDGARGRALYFQGAGVTCRNCHRVGKEGHEVGPDLSEIGKRYDRARLLESILEPSKTIDPAYVTYLLETTRGAVHSGLLVKKTEAEVVLKSAEGKLLTVPAREVETLVPQQKSLMPELLLRDMTAQQVADLLEFLASLK